MDIFELHQKIVSDYSNYIRSFVSISDKDLRQRVGNDEFHVVLPIVSEAKNEAGIVRRAIKPLDLDRKEPTAIYEHGDVWLKRIERLRQVNQLPERMLFTLREPVEGEKRLKACNEVRVLPHGDENGVLEFAKLDTN